MKIYNVLDVREREGKKPAYAEVGTIFWNEETGKISLYLPIFGRFFPVKLQQSRQQQQGTSYPQAANAPPPHMPGAPYSPSPDHLPPMDGGPHNPPGDPDQPLHYPGDRGDEPF